MRIASLLNEGSMNINERKRIMQRKEMNEAYKKNVSYNQASKKAALEILENLLSGKTEKELFDNDHVSLNEENENVEAESTEALTNSLLSETEVASTEDESYDPFSDEQFEFTIPDRFLQSFNRDVNGDTKQLASLLFERTYNKAVSTYTYQMQLAQQGFVIEGAQYSLTA